MSARAKRGKFFDDRTLKPRLLSNLVDMHISLSGDDADLP
jgi:hypothetical protein